MYDPEQPLPEHLRPKPEPAQRRRGLRDVDSSAVAFRMKAFTWSGAGLVMGALIGTLLTTKGMSPLVIPVAAVMVWAFVYFGTLWLSERAGRAMSSVYFSGGGSTPPLRQYSLADSMIARARFDEAAAELQRAAEQYAADPEPCLRLARLLRDHMMQYEAAARWLREAIARSASSQHADIAATRELIEIYTHRLRTPARALPDLARLAARYPDAPAAEWARRQLAEIKRDMRQENEL